MRYMWQLSFANDADDGEDDDGEDDEREVKVLAD